MNASEFAATIDHTLLKADSTELQVRELCKEALEHSFASVCVLPTYVHTANDMLDGSTVAVCTVVGFPLGATFGMVKSHEARESIARGATEIDMVMNVSALKNGYDEDVLYDMEEVVEVAYSLGAMVKVIVETCLLTAEEKVRAAELVTKAQADFIKTSTGFSSGGATVDDVLLLSKHIGPKVKVKASGGIKTLDDALALLNAGAHRLGASSSMKLLEEYKSRFQG